MERSRVIHLGQSGFRFEFGRTVVYVDPYLSDSVAEAEGGEFRRLVPVSTPPDTVDDAGWVLSTHIHLDHADPQTLLPIATASPRCRFLGPPEVVDLLRDLGIEEQRIGPSVEQWVELGPALRVRAVPAAHKTIERNASGLLRFVGYVFEHGRKRIYHAGDTLPDDEVVDAVTRLGKIDVAFLPVNECNYYRDKRGIVGNMSLREAFQFACDIGAGCVVPMHWDMFLPNRVYRQEIELFYALANPSFEMDMSPEWV